MARQPLRDHSRMGHQNPVRRAPPRRSRRRAVNQTVDGQHVVVNSRTHQRVMSVHACQARGRAARSAASVKIRVHCSSETETKLTVPVLFIDPSQPDGIQPLRPQEWIAPAGIEPHQPGAARGDAGDGRLTAEAAGELLPAEAARIRIACV
jgi:hypothetical protein